MMDNSRYLYRALCSAESATGRALFASRRKFLFLADDATTSKLDAYHPDVIGRSSYNDSHQEDQSMTYTSQFRLATPCIDDHQGLELVSLRNKDEIANYDGKTNGFRVYFIRQKYSYAPLTITSTLFDDMLSTLRISVRMKDVILYFGQRDREVEKFPPRLKYRVLPLAETKHPKGYEHTYGLRFFEKHGRSVSNDPLRQWSMRQTAIYCQYEPGLNGTTWLFVTLSKQMERNLDDYVAHQSDLQLSNPFDIHLLCLDAALSNWRLYLIDIAGAVDDYTAKISGMSSDDSGPVSLAGDDTGQKLLALDEKLLNALLVAKATLDTVQTLAASAAAIASAMKFDSTFTQDVLNDQACDLHLYIVQLETLQTKLSNASKLLSNLLDRNSGLALQNLARESRQENEVMRKLSERMHDLTRKSTKDAAAVKVLTILTLVYLPVAVVSNFFSTSFVSTEGPANHISISSDCWILVVVSVPLTVLTLYIWYVCKEFQADEKRPAWWPCFSKRKSTGGATQLAPPHDAGDKV